MRYLIGAILLFLLGGALPLNAQEVVLDTVTFEKAEVIEVLSEDTRLVPGTDTTTQYQTIKVKLLEGAQAGAVITVENDYILLQEGEAVYLRHLVNRASGRDVYSVAEPYRLPVVLVFVGLFLLCLLVFGGKQGMRGLLALGLSLFFISHLLLPGILAGYPPVLVATGVSALIIVLGSYITHGFNRTTSTAVVGMLATLFATIALAYAAIHAAHLSGYSSEEAVYLNFDTRGGVDFIGLLLGGFMIGILGVLYDAAIGQAIAVEELFAAGKHLSPREVYLRALRIGREHIGALVNTLAIAYAGAALPLLLLLQVSYTQSLEVTLNQELFATEILRTVIGAIGIILTVPITTAVAVWMLNGKPSQAASAHSHHH